jgi:hypothetical protein
MADIPNPSPLTNPIGTPFDDPPTVDDVAAGQPGTTIFALLKVILVYLVVLTDTAGK